MLTLIHFYPRSPCGERRGCFARCRLLASFLSTLSLRRATGGMSERLIATVFLSTLSLRRATFKKHIFFHQSLFLSTLSLRRATIAGRITSNGTKISIHALLAESDALKLTNTMLNTYFYPRSPCGERPWTRGSRVTYVEISIHALLAESDARRASRQQPAGDFYPRSPCGERPI